MDILKIEIRYDICNLIYLNYSTVYNIILIGNILYEF